MTLVLSSRQAQERPVETGRPAVGPTMAAQLDAVLGQARNALHAQQGCLYLLNGSVLMLGVVQGDQLEQAGRHVGGEISFETDCLPVRVVRLNRAIRTWTPGQAGHESAIAIPLKSAAGVCVGVLELFNCLDGLGEVVPFPDPNASSVLSTALSAGIHLDNVLLRVQVSQAHLETVRMLSRLVQFRDGKDSLHIHRVSRTCGLIASRLNLREGEAHLIAQAALLHDVGNIVLSDTVLEGTSDLSTEQRTQMQRHTLAGSQILDGCQGELLRLARDCALSHHERWDGRGYPYGLAGTEIPLIGRITAIADSLDAMISPRLYRPAGSVEVACSVLRQERGRQLDGQLVEACLDQLESVLEAYRPALNPAGTA